MRDVTGSQSVRIVINGSVAGSVVQAASSTLFFHAEARALSAPRQ
ncbi:hypothetical protein [Amycolatopsis sp. NPDC051071]